MKRVPVSILCAFAAAAACAAEPEIPACDANNPDFTPAETDITPAQKRALEDFALSIFAPELPGYGTEAHSVSRRDLLARFGRPTAAASRERAPHDPTDPTEIVTQWEFPGLRITTIASQPRPDVFQIERGEVFDAKVALRQGLRIGQPLALWVRKLGLPTCSNGRWAYSGEHYFACGAKKDISCVATYQVDLVLDPARKVERIKWSHPML